MAKARILVVEDNRIVAKDIQQSLEVLGYTVFKTVPSGETAIEVAKEDKPDLIPEDSHDFFRTLFRYGNRTLF